MRHFPREIEADLLFRGIDIFDWHQGRMSSRRLLVLIRALEADHKSTYWRERNDWDWNEEEYLRAAIVNEIRLLRADQAAIHAQHDMKIDMVSSPAQRKAEMDLAERTRQVREHIMKQLNPTK
ncbi:hypothetical protein DQP57_00375 [Mycobacterium colombiense]|uniref:Uncharacterized protein n=1 Tax=Mycobacterium colombiense TaxID=339268 RepID=A0A329MC83_9MYCO|nr:hypothetical protein [Mycobacterium colombiense]RAV17514.1 hypothetical protein DQP57_00375 [Mycobacterium colombiense]